MAEAEAQEASGALASENGIFIPFCATCRICQDVGGEDTLVEPCNCAAPRQYVHAACLAGQLTSGRRFWDTGMPNLTCDACQSDYPRKMVVRPGNRREWSQLCSGALLYLVLRMAFVIGALLWIAWPAPEMPTNRALYAILWVSILWALLIVGSRLPPGPSEIPLVLNILLRDVVVRKRSMPQETPMDAVAPLAELNRI